MKNYWDVLNILFSKYTIGSNTAPELALLEDPANHILNVIFKIIITAIGNNIMLMMTPALNQAVQNLERSIPHFIILRLKAVVNHFILNIWISKPVFFRK